MDNVDPTIAEWRKNGYTYKNISLKLQQAFPLQKGFSDRTVRRYCNENGFGKRTEEEIDEVVEEAVTEVY